MILVLNKISREHNLNSLLSWTGVRFWIYVWTTFAFLIGEYDFPKMNWIDSLLRSALFTLFWSKAIFTLNRHSKDNTFSTSWKGWSHNSCTDDRSDLCKVANGYSENALYQHCKWITTHQNWHSWLSPIQHIRRQESSTNSGFKFYLCCRKHCGNAYNCGLVDPVNDHKDGFMCKFITEKMKKKKGE